MKRHAGFTIIEMLVTISVFAIIASIVLANYPAFLQQIALDRAAQRVGLSLREAKTFSLGVKEFPLGATPTSFPWFGVHLDVIMPKNYILFADIDKNNQYFNEMGSPEKIKEVVIQGTASLEGMCVGEQSDASNSDECAPAGVYPIGAKINDVDIVFARPDPTITFYNPELSQLLGDQTITIFIATPNSNTKKIEVWKTGQISVK